jgi:hypothetical protein
LLHRTLLCTDSYLLHVFLCNSRTIHVPSVYNFNFTALLDVGHPFLYVPLLRSPTRNIFWHITIFILNSVSMCMCINSILRKFRRSSLHADCCVISLINNSYIKEKAQATQITQNCLDND